MEPQLLADTFSPEDLDLAALADAVDLHGLPGVQNNASAWMLNRRRQAQRLGGRAGPGHPLHTALWR